MILSTLSIRSTRLKMLSPIWILNVLRAHLDSNDVFRLGLRLVALGMALLALSLTLLVAGFSAKVLLLGNATLATLERVACILNMACFGSPIGRRLLGVHWLLMLLCGPATFQFGGAAGSCCWLAGSVVFLAFIFQVARHFQLARTTRYVRAASFLYGSGLVPLLYLWQDPRSDVAALTFLAIVIFGIGLYIRGLTQAVRAIPVSGKPFRPVALLKDLHLGLRNWFKIAYRLQ